MDKLTNEEILDLQEQIMDRLAENLTHVLLALNVNERLEDLLHLLEMDDLIEGPKRLDTWPDGKIVVVGSEDARPRDLYGVAGSLGLDRDRMDFISYDEAERHNFKNYEYNHGVVAVLFGSVPHSAPGKGSYSSILARMEKETDVFPRVYTLRANNKLKVTKTNFREALEGLIGKGLLVV